MSSHRFSQWIALGALWLGAAGPLSTSAYAAGQQQLSQNEAGGQSTLARTDRGAVRFVIADAVIADAVIAGVPSSAAAKSNASTSRASRRWSGLHVGFNIGAGSGNGDTFVNPLPNAATFINLLPQTLHPNPSGVTGGGVMGLSWQRKAFVFGFEGDVSVTDIGGTKTVTPIVQNNGIPFPGAGFVSAHEDIPWMITVRPRLGIGFSRLLIYGTGGVALARVNYAGDTDFRPVGTTQYLATPNQTQTGWTGGAGAEIGFATHWGLKGEYLHYDLGSVSMTVNPQISLPPFQVAYTWQTTGNIVRFGLNYHI
jgi:outer membrane immunogenic protein